MGDKYTFGELLRSLRVRTGLTQAELAEKIGMRRQTISDWERGNHLPRHYDHLLAIADALDASERERQALLSAALRPCLEPARSEVIPPQAPEVISGRYPGLEEYVYDFTKTIENATRWFIGRQFVFDAVEKFIQNYSCGYFRIVAEAGWGKTVIAAELIKRYEALAYLINASQGLARARQCLNHLSVQLIARYRLSHERLPAHAGEDASFLLALLDEAAEMRRDDQSIIIVIDALDEAEPVPPGHNWLHLPDRLPEGVYVIVTHRPGDYLLRTDAHTPVEELVVARDDPRQMADIETYLQRQAREREEIRRVLEGASPPIPVESFVTALKGASEGNFMYLAYVLEDIAHREPGFDLLRLEKLPRGLMGYYQQFWEQMERVREREGWSEWDNLYRPVIGLLGVAGEPVTVEWLADHVGREGKEVQERALLRWQRFLNRERRQGEETWWVIHHSFGDFLAEKLDLRGFHWRVAEYYLSDPSRWGEHNGYAFRHLSAHLARAGMVEELRRLVEQQRWYEAHLAYDPTLRAYAWDVERAIEVVGRQGIEGLPKVVAWSLLYGALRDLATNVPMEAIEAMVSLGDERRALYYTEFLTDPERQVEAHRRIASRLQEQGRTIQAREAVDRALQAAEGIQTARGRARALTDIAWALLQIGEVEEADRALAEAQAVAEGIAPERWRVKAFCGLAQALVEVGNVEEMRWALDQALEIAEGIGDECERVEAWCDVVQAMISVGEVEQSHQILAHVLEMARDLWGEPRLGEAREISGRCVDGMTAVTQALIRVEGGRGLPQVKAMAEILQGSLLYDNLLGSMAETLTQVGEFDLAREVLEDVEIELLRAQPLHILSRALAQMGEFDRALEIAESITDERQYAEALSDVARSLSESGEVKRARQVMARARAIAEKIQDKDECLVTLSNVAQVMVKIGEMEQARQVLDDVLQAAGGMWYGIWSDIAEAMSGVAQALAYAREFDLAFEAAEWVVDDQRYAETLCGIAHALAQAGERERLLQVLEVAERVPGEHQRAEVLAIVAQALIQVGEMERAHLALTRAERAGDKVEIGGYRAEILRSVALTWAWAGEFERALEMIKNVSDAYFFIRDGALRDVACMLVGVGKFDRALGVVEDIEGWDERAAALREIVQALAQAGDHSRALEVAQWTVRRDEYVVALCTVARALAQIGEMERAHRVLASAREAVGEVLREDRARALASVAQVWVEMGEAEKAKSVLLLAQALAHKVSRKWQRAWALANVARVWIKMGDSEQARRRMTSILQAVADGEDGDDQVKALIETARVLIEIEDWEGLGRILAAAGGIRDDARCTEALKGLAQVLVQVAEQRDLQVSQSMVAILQTARERGSRVVSRYIGALAPVLGRLGVIRPTWESIQAVEAVFGP